MQLLYTGATLGGPGLKSFKDIWTEHFGICTVQIAFLLSNQQCQISAQTCCNMDARTRARTSCTTNLLFVDDDFALSAPENDKLRMEIHTFKTSGLMIHV